MIIFEETSGIKKMAISNPGRINKKPHHLSAAGLFFEVPFRHLRLAAEKLPDGWGKHGGRLIYN